MEEGGEKVVVLGVAAAEVAFLFPLSTGWRFLEEIVEVQVGGEGGGRREANYKIREEGLIRRHNFRLRV